MKARQIIADILILAAVVFTLYLSVIMVHRIRTVVLRDTYIRIFSYELIACAIFLLFALDLRFGFLTATNLIALKVVGWLVRIIVVLAFSVILFFVGKVTVNPESTLILTGGNPDRSGRTEAAVMRDILLERGVPEEKLTLEDQARTTKDNFRNAAQLIDPDEPVVLISSNYHMDRAVMTAKSAGFTHVLRLPAPSSALNFGANVMWEVVLEMNDLTHRR